MKIQCPQKLLLTRYITASTTNNRYSLQSLSMAEFVDLMQFR